MAELALMPHSTSNAGVEEVVESIADHNFARKKMLSLEQGFERLRKDARQQHESVLQLAGDMKLMVSEVDLRRAIGLAFQEFELRLEDVFHDSNRKCLAVFSKREEVMELQALIGKKVNWTEYNTVLKKLSDLRQYIDTMAESVFIGHRDALNSEFAKKADASFVNEALKSKADFGEVSEVRARLERLEVLVLHTDTKFTTQLEELRASAAKQCKTRAEEQQAIMREHESLIEALRRDHVSVATKLGSFENELKAIKETGRRMLEIEQALNGGRAGILRSISEMQEQLARVEEAAEETRGDLLRLGEEAEEHRGTSGQKFKELSSQGDAFRERLDFLMQATEMMKRKSRETNKTTASKFTEISGEQEKYSNTLASLERLLKKQERDLRAVEHRASKAEGTQGFRALPPPGPPEFEGGGALASDAPNERLKQVMEQLQAIAGGGHPFEQMGVDIDPMRPPLPWSDRDERSGGVRLTHDVDTSALSRFAGTAGPAPIDSARGGAVVSFATAVGRHGLSPRPAQGLGSSSAMKTPRKKK
eukprot:TRINITY_DN61966_c0_g1_i1.p1 TRINITY_DN61966_c0_g1~~TRINITY_DN61966_c0_g1_i1.p1  ORF type:complete len:536 (+),score=141.23 TRINITY_DN61966_c0_g1_i1:100-1707(+)